MYAESPNSKHVTAKQRLQQAIVALPNILTLTRIILIPFFVWMLVDPTPRSQRIAMWVFIIAALTDYLDGAVARAFKTVSDLGKLLDPIADKVLVMAALVMLVSMRNEVNGEPWLPGWMVVFILAREFWVTGVRGIAARNGLIIAAAPAGKTKSALQMVAIVLLLMHDKGVPLFGIVLTGQVLGTNLLILSLIFSYWGAIEYTAAAFPGLKITKEIAENGD